MQKLIPAMLIVLSTSLFAYGQATIEPQRSEFLNVKYWSDLGKPTEGSRGFTLFTRHVQPKTDTRFELWLKIVPNNTSAFNKRYSLPRESSFVVQFATVDCAKRTVMLEQTASYDQYLRSLDPRGSDLVKNEMRSRVLPGSIADTAFKYLCLELQ